MATLVQFLASGVNGAESGTATFFLRGTTTSAAAFLYDDFEETSQPGTNVIQLDSWGRADVYCDVYCDVVTVDAEGFNLRTATIGHSDGLVEVQSASFTGTAYDGDPSNTAGEPITLKAVLDKWLTSAGATDWRVLVNGVASNLSSAFSAFSGIFINVKDPQYGAEGDGATNDTVAITNAIAAAESNGGIVVFPPGTYLISNVAVNAPGVALLGFGQARIRVTSGSGFIFNDIPGELPKIIQGLRFDTNATAGTVLEFLGSGGANITIDNCTFTADGFTDEVLLFDGAGGTYNITRCSFELSTTLANPALNHVGGDGKVVNVDHCQFVLPVGYVETVVAGSCFNISNSVFDGSLVTAGAYTMVNPADPVDPEFIYGFVRGCEFSNGGSSGNVFRLENVSTDSRFIERDNAFFGFTTAYIHSNSVPYNDTIVVTYGSREGAQFSLTNSGFTTLTISAPLQYERFVVAHTNASNLTLTFTGTDRPFGLSWDAVVLNNSGGARDIIFVGSGQSITLSAVPDGGRAIAHYFTYLETPNTVAVGIASTATALT